MAAQFDQVRKPMSRIPIYATEQAPSAAQPLLASAKKQLGTVPNRLDMRRRLDMRSGRNK